MINDSRRKISWQEKKDPDVPGEIEKKKENCFDLESEALFGAS